MPDQPELTEILDADVERVDGVLGPANGMPFLILKSGGEQPEPQALTGAAAEVPAEAGDQASAAAPVEKAEESAAAINDLPDSDFAYIEPGGEKDDEGKTTPRSKRHFPIHDASHVRNALGRAPQSPFGEKAMPRIRAAAKKFGVEVSKQGADEEPGSSAWEAQDAAALRGIAAQLADLKVRLEASADRERAEVAAVGDVDDLEDAWDLDDAVMCLTGALGIVARLAFTEQQEALQPDAAMVKAGRRLSAKTTAAIEAARRSLTELLGEPDPELEPNEITTNEGVAEVTKAEIEQILTEKLAPIAQALSERGAVTKDAAPETPAATEAPPAEPAAPAAPAPTEAPPSTDTAAAAPPAPAAEPVEKATIPTETADVSALLKSVVVDAVTAAVQPLEDRLAKMEQQPMPGGPFLRGAGAPRADYLVTRGQEESTAAYAGPDGVSKALEEIRDPAERDRVGRALAHAMHPYAAQARQG